MQPLSSYENWLMAAFITISHGRDYVDGVALPIKLSEIESYIRMIGDVDISIIQALDNTFLRHINAKEDEIPIEAEEATMDWLFS